MGSKEILRMLYAKNSATTSEIALALNQKRETVFKLLQILKVYNYVTKKTDIRMDKLQGGKNSFIPHKYVTWTINPKSILRLKKYIKIEE